MEDQELEPVSIQVVKKGHPDLISFRDPESLAKLMDQPLPTIAAALTGALSSGYSDAVLIGGRLVQGALKGKLYQQVAREINDLVEKGKIKEDYANTKYGFKSLVELLEFIDSEVPDEDRLQAVKAMFVAVNAVEAKQGEELVNYQRNCLACFGPVEPLNFAVFQAFSRIRKNRRPGNRAVSQRGTPDVADFMEHETLNKYLSASTN